MGDLKASGMSQRLRAYEVLHNILVLGRIPAGQRLGEVEWTKCLGVNRAALREALGRLYSEGLVVEGEKCGYRVPDLSQADVEDIREVRQSIEITAIERIIRTGRNGREYLRRLEVLCDELECMLERHYTIEITEADYLFHRGLVELCTNRRLVLVHKCLPQVRPDALGPVAESKEQFLAMLREHRAILDAICEGDMWLAQSLIQRHYRPEGVQSEELEPVLQIADRRL
jgi:DNA-binding GntR family transcriptional regulator